MPISRQMRCGGFSSINEEDPWAYMSTVTIDIVTPKLSAASLRQALVASARELQPLLERNASRTEADRRVVEENLTAIRSADLLTIAVPRRFGGLETDIRTMLRGLA
jgi:hypothetical protein